MKNGSREVSKEAVIKSIHRIVEGAENLNRFSAFLNDNCIWKWYNIHKYVIYQILQRMVPSADRI